MLRSRRTLHGMFTGELIGGPFDGMSLPSRSGTRGPWVWVECDLVGSRVRVRTWTSPALGRELYRLEEVTRRCEVFLYAGHTHTVCSCCNGLNAVTASGRCQVCGGALIVNGVEGTH